MAQIIGATGVALPPPQALYPATINQTPGVSATNIISLPPGGDILIPPGWWYINPGNFSMIQVLDPVSNTWTTYNNAGSSPELGVNSDGVNYRLINPCNFPIGAVTTNGGTGYTSAPVAAAGSGGSTWLAVMGLGVVAINVASGGSGANYNVAPIINIAAPPTPGVQATAVCTLSGGSISLVQVTNPGGGYASAPAIAIIPQASDFNNPATAAVPPAAIKNAVAVAQMSYAGIMTNLLLTNEGNNPLSAAPAITFSGGAGSGAAVTVQMALAVNGYGVTSGGSGYTAPAEIVLVGGSLVGLSSGLAAVTSSNFYDFPMAPRRAMILGNVVSGAIATTGSAGGGVVIPGLFLTPPLAYVSPGPQYGLATNSSPTALAVVTATIASAQTDTVYLTPL